MVKYYDPAIYGDTPINDEYGYEGRLYVSEDDYTALEARLAELEKDAVRINWLESFVSKQYVYGVSFDYAKSFEGERGGYRLMARRRLNGRKDSLRESIDDAMSREA